MKVTVQATYETDPLWEIVTVWASGELRPEIDELIFRAPLGELTPAKIKQLPLAGLMDRHREQVASAALLLDGPWAEKALHAFRTPAVKGPRRGRDLSEAVLAETAAVYLEAANENMPVTAAVENHFEISASTASKRIMAARAAGFLPPKKGNTR